MSYNEAILVIIFFFWNEQSHKHTGEAENIWKSKTRLLNVIAMCVCVFFLLLMFFFTLSKMSSYYSACSICKRIIIDHVWPFHNWKFLYNLKIEHLNFLYLITTRASFYRWRQELTRFNSIFFYSNCYFTAHFSLNDTNFLKIKWTPNEVKMSLVIVIVCLFFYSLVVNYRWIIVISFNRFDQKINK